MSHNDYNLNRDLLRPLQEFLQTVGFETQAIDGSQVPDFKTLSLNEQTNPMQ